MKTHISQEQISAWVDRQLDPEAMAEINRHLEACADCQAAAHEMSDLTAAFRSAAALELPPHLWARISAGLQEASADRRGRLRRLLVPALGQPTWAPAAAVAAVAALTLMAGVLWVEQRSAARLQELAFAEIEQMQQSLSSLDAEKFNPFRLPDSGGAEANPFTRGNPNPALNPFSGAHVSRQ